VSYFRAVRIYSAFESLLFTSLLVVWIGGFDESLKQALGWAHGFGWIFLCLLVANGCRKRVFPWWLLAFTVSPFGPLGSSLGIELLARERRGMAERPAG